jgi:hypothetical protein
MSLAAALIYWVIISVWLAVLATVCVAFVRKPRTFGAVRLLLSVVVIDTARNIIENLYFGLYFGGQYGLFPAAIVGVLGNPAYLILPKVMTRNSSIQRISKLPVAKCSSPAPVSICETLKRGTFTRTGE